MTQAKNKTIKTDISPKQALEALPKAMQSEAKDAIKLFEAATGKSCKMWGSMFGFGEYHYVYDSGREGDFFAVGFAVRKTELTFYIKAGIPESTETLKKLGKYKLSGSCLHIKQLQDIDLKVLEKLIKQGFKDVQKTYKVT